MPHDKRKCRREARQHGDNRGNYHSRRAYLKAKKRETMAKESRRKNRKSRR